jgi:hypothetical protein
MDRKVAFTARKVAFMARKVAFTAHRVAFMGRKVASTAVLPAMMRIPERGTEGVRRASGPSLRDRTKAIRSTIHED